MEKKNTILLTVIAIATLLVAVVGATFAYFTAQVTTSNNDNNTVRATTYALTEVTMNYGSLVESKGMYPGTTLRKDAYITTKCPDNVTTCEPVNSVITITTTDEDDVFGNDIKWTLYRMNSKTDEVECTVTDHTTGGKYYATSTCTGLDNGTEVATGTGAGVKTIKVRSYGVDDTTKGYTKTDEKYYLVVEYLDRTVTTGEGEEAVTTTTAQNEQQGHTFSVAMTFATVTDDTATYDFTVDAHA